ncbi:MAG: peptidylprolyl isomerase [Candidatus Aerophobetes bacterium]|nr:peptidylprolyl isomerase [Candidatus Aerophobetes bacterium]
MILRKLRESVKPIVWAVIIGFAASLFFAYGLHRSEGEKPIVKVNGVPISYASFAQAYKNVYESYQQKYQGSIPSQLEGYLRYQVLSQLITTELIWQEVKKANIKVSEGELTERIKKMIRNFPSRDAFTRYLNYKHIPYNDFKQEVKKQLAIDKLIERIKESASVTGEEVKDYWLKEKERIKFEYMLLKVENYEEEINTTQKEIEKYYTEHKDEFTIPEKVSVSYILVNPEDFAEKVKLTEEVLKKYYDTHLKEFEVPEKREASHILIRVASGEREKEAEKKIEEMKKKIEGGSDFALLAKKYSQDKTSAEKGGDLGFLTYNEMIPSFSEALFSLKKVGGVSEVVKTPFGYHLIKLTGIKPAYTEPFEKVKEEIKKRLLKEKSEELAEKEAEKIKKEFKNYIKEHPGNLKTTPFFARTESFIQDLGRVPQFTRVAFSLKEEEISPPLQTLEGYCLLKLKERKPSHIPELKEITGKVEKALVKKKSTEFAYKKAEQIVKKGKEGDSFSSLAQKFNLDYKRLKYLKREDQIEGINRAEDREKFINALFSLGKEKISKPLLLRDEYYIIKLLDRDPQWDEFHQRKEEITRNLLSQKKREYVNTWLEKLNKKAKIVDNTGLFFPS